MCSNLFLIYVVYYDEKTYTELSSSRVYFLCVNSGTEKGHFSWFPKSTLRQQAFLFCIIKN